MMQVVTIRGCAASSDLWRTTSSEGFFSSLLFLFLMHDLTLSHRSNKSVSALTGITAQH